MIQKSGYRFSLATNADAFARRSCSNKKVERDDDSKKSHHALAIRRPAPRRYLERRKIKAGCDRAAHQRPVAGAFGSLPCLYRDNGLRHFARGEIGTESHAALAAIAGNLQAQRVARVVMPDLHRIDAMPVRALAPRQQEMDLGGQRTSRGGDTIVAKRLAKMPAFRMRLQREPPDDAGGRGPFNHQD